MLSKEEIELNHTISLELLDKFLEVCQKYDIDYYLAFGSCLGAVRHKGFIPWDINIDILMRVEEFERLDKAMQSEDLGNKEWCCPGGRMFNLLRRFDSEQYETDPNIDISLYSDAPSNEFLRKLMFRVSYFNIKMFKLKTTNVGRAFPFNILKFITSIFPNKFYLGVVKFLTKVAKSSSDYDMVLLPSIWENREYIKKEWYGEEPTYAEFEGRKVKILKNSHEYLTMRYGKSYMTPKVWVDKGEYKYAKK